jgi:CheY-like chemotaxis protein
MGILGAETLSHATSTSQPGYRQADGSSRSIQRRDECLAKGLNDYLSKPLHWKKLKEVLERLLAH